MMLRSPEIMDSIWCDFHFPLMASVNSFTKWGSLYRQKKEKENWVFRHCKQPNVIICDDFELICNFFGSCSVPSASDIWLVSEEIAFVSNSNCLFQSVSVYSEVVFFVRMIRDIHGSTCGPLAPWFWELWTTTAFIDVNCRFYKQKILHIDHSVEEHCRRHRLPPDAPQSETISQITLGINLSQLYQMLNSDNTNSSRFKIHSYKLHEDEFAWKFIVYFRCVFELVVYVCG